MGAIANILKRWGYAKLDHYGLLLTAEDRVLSTRHAVLDDGLGAKVVGWRDGDLAAMQLDTWGAPRAAAAKSVAAIDRLQSPAPRPVVATAQIAPPRAAAAVAVIAPVPAAPAPAPAPAPVLEIVAAPPAEPPKVAEEPAVEEDEWEWEIAMARARAAAEQVEQAAQTIQAPSWPQQDTVAETWEYNEPQAPRAAAAPSRVVTPSAAAPARTPARTVIPVPTLPTAADPRNIRPVYTASASASASRRMARGTARIDEATVRTGAAPAANDDRTAPYIELPSEVRPVGFAHTKRVAAKHR